MASRLSARGAHHHHTHARALTRVAWWTRRADQRTSRERRRVTKKKHEDPIGRTSRERRSSLAPCRRRQVTAARSLVAPPLPLELCQDLPYARPHDMWALGCVLHEVSRRRPRSRCRSRSLYRHWRSVAAASAGRRRMIGRRSSVAGGGSRSSRPVRRGAADGTRGRSSLASRCAPCAWVCVHADCRHAGLAHRGPYSYSACRLLFDDVVAS